MRTAEKRILYTGAVSPHKGIHVLLEAFRLVLERFSNVRLDIAGPIGSYPIEENCDLKDRERLDELAQFYAGPKIPFLATRFLSSPSTTRYMAHLRSLVPENMSGKVTFLGFIGHRSQLVDLYYNADVFAFTPTWDEGFWPSPVEAMTAGTPVVASRSGAVVETVKQHETGFLVEKNNPQQGAEAITTLLENDSLRETMGKCARQHVLKHFTWDAVGVCTSVTMPFPNNQTSRCKTCAERLMHVPPNSLASSGRSTTLHRTRRCSTGTVEPKHHSRSAKTLDFVIKALREIANLLVSGYLGTSMTSICIYFHRRENFT